MTRDNATADPIDLYVGERIRMRRKFLRMSRAALAEALGLVFQQVQKYEGGFNRISASKLFETARTLKVPVSYFFDGYGENGLLDGSIASRSKQAIHGFLTTPEGIELAEAFPRIKNVAHRRKIVELVRILAEN